MTVATRLDDLDVGRGVKLAQFVYWQRCKREPPAITEARFENGKVLATYRATPHAADKPASAQSHDRNAA
jgi:hypothetical protein